MPDSTQIRLSFHEKGRKVAVLGLEESNWWMSWPVWHCDICTPIHYHRYRETIQLIKERGIGEINGDMSLTCKTRQLFIGAMTYLIWIFSLPYKLKQIKFCTCSFEGPPKMLLLICVFLLNYLQIMTSNSLTSASFFV